MGTLATYKPLYVWCSPASIPQIVAHIQDYLVKNPIVSTETVAEIVVQSLQEHPELINGDVIPITEDSAQTIKEYIDALPSLDGYTKAETDALLLLKQNLLTWDQTPTVGSSNPVTSEGIKAAISASAAALADLISTKADIASVYTKATTDALLLQKADAATTYSKNAVDALLDTKVDINDTYTKADIDLMKQVDKANTAIVSAADGTAPLNIAAGQYVYLGDILYMATEPIPEGDPLVPGTNIALNPKGVTNVIGDGLQNLARTVGEQSDQIEALGPIANLTSTSSTAALAASQGKVLNDHLTSIGSVVHAEASNLNFQTTGAEQTICEVTLTPGKWLLLGSVTAGIASSVTLSPVFRGPAGYEAQNYNSNINNGGWISSIFVVEISTTRTVSLAEWIYNASNNYGGKLTAIRLN